MRKASFKQLGLGRWLSILLMAGLIFAQFSAAIPVQAAVTLTVTPLTWNIIGLDSNDPLSGPQYFPVGARVCSSVATTNVTVAWVWDSANANIKIRTGSSDTILIPSLAVGGCYDAYFEVEVVQDAAAFDTTRGYHITATDTSGTASSPTPRELYVEHLISQNRNAITNVILDGVTIPVGGSMSLVVGQTYTLVLVGGTATQGYNQFESFINFPNTIFQILSVSTTYSAENSPYVPAPNLKLYADACKWDNDPNSPNYRSCVGGDYKAGGSTVETTYSIKVLSGSGTEMLSSLLYDFSGSSFHYNADYTTGARIANIIDPATSSNISKIFSPNPTTVNGISTLTFTLTNPNATPVGGYNFTDSFPANMVVANPTGASTTGCGTPTFNPVAGASAVSFSNGTLAANSICLVKVNVTTSVATSYINTTGHLMIDTIDTGKTGSDTLVVGSAPAAPTCIAGITLAAWNFDAATTAATPEYSTKDPAVTTAAASGSLPAGNYGFITNPAIGTQSWTSYGYPLAFNAATGAYAQFRVSTSSFSQVQMAFSLRAKNQGPTSVKVYYSTNGTDFTDSAGTFAGIPSNAFGSYSQSFTGLTNSSGDTYFRMYLYGAASTANNGGEAYIDSVSFTGCGDPQPPRLSKAFSTNPVKVNGTSPLVFTLTNPNMVTALNNVSFSDTLPAGLELSDGPAAQPLGYTSTCAGTLNVSPALAVGGTTIGFSGANLPVNSSCTVTVNYIKATTAGPHSNVSGFVSGTVPATSQTITNNTSSGFGSDALTAVLPPSMTKQFLATPILANGTSTLVFTITNPNQNNAISGVAFSDVFPTTPGQMSVAATPNASTSGCGSPTFAPTAGANSISFTGGSVAAGGTCTVELDVTAPTVGTYTNTSGLVSHIINTEPVTGDLDSDTLEVQVVHPAVTLLKQVGLTNDVNGTWGKFAAVAPGTSVYYKFTIENSGDAPLTDVNVTDATLTDLSVSLTAYNFANLPTYNDLDEQRVTCVVGPISAASSGLHTNTAAAHGTANSTVYNSADSSATYGITGLSMTKRLRIGSAFSKAGDQLTYAYTLTNTGSVARLGPVTVTDDKLAVDPVCPSLSTVGDTDAYLDPGEVIMCEGTYTITAADMTAGEVTNTAFATVGGVTSPRVSLTAFTGLTLLTLVELSAAASTAPLWPLALLLGGLLLVVGLLRRLQ